MNLVDRFIDWAKRGVPARDIVTHGERKFLFRRWEFLRSDEWPDSFIEDHKASCKCSFCPVCKKGWRPSALPWWLPANAFLHRWEPEPGAHEEFHDHPRWSMTICLKGRITEVTPWGSRTLRPGSIVIRSRRAIHRFEVPEEAGPEIWTLFIVGRRKHRQNTFQVTPQ